MLTSHASSAVLVPVVGLGIAVSGGYVQSSVPTGNGVIGKGFVLTGVRGGRRDVGSRVRLILVSLGRLLYAEGARVAVSSSDRRPRRRAMGGAKGVTGDMRSGFRALPWNGAAVGRPVVLIERLLPLRECTMLALRDWVRRLS